MDVYTLFLVKECQIALKPGQEFHQHFEGPNNQAGYFLNQDDKKVYELEVKRKLIPIEETRMYEKDGIVKSSLVAIDPLIKSVILNGVEHRMESMASNYKMRTKTLEQDVESLEKIIDDFNKMPWYKRIIAALKKIP